MSQLLEFAREVFMDCSSLEKVCSSYGSYLGIKREEDVTFEDFVEEQKSDMLKALWNYSFEVTKFSAQDRINTYANPRYHFNKMSITKWIATSLDKIGKDKTFYFLGKRFTKVKDVQKLCEHYNWTWEKKDASKADFFILGDNPTAEEARLNTDLKKPVVMDDDLRVSMHFLFNKDVIIDEVDNDLVAMYLNKGGYDHVKLVVSMIQYLKEDVLTPANKYRLIRAYVHAFAIGRGRVEFSLKNKDHVWMSDTVQRYCHPQHRYLVTNNFLRFPKWNISRSGNRAGEVQVYNSNSCIIAGVSYLYKTTFSYLHKCEGMEEVIQSDLDEFNEYSLIERPRYNSSNKYVSCFMTTIIPDSVYKYKIVLPHLNDIVIYAISRGNNEYEILDIGLVTENYSDELKEITILNNFTLEVWNKFKDLLRAHLPMLIICSGSSMDFNEAEKNTLGLILDEFITENRLYGNDQEKNLAQLKFKARKLAVLDA